MRGRSDAGWNFGTVSRDSIEVDCQNYREALSARLDGEQGPVPDDALDHHLEVCAACRSWQQRTVELSRTLRVRSVQPTPDLTDAVLSAATPLRDRFLTRRWPRLLLGLVALCQLALGVVQIFGAGMVTLAHGMGSSMSEHLFNESTSWNLALGAGMLWAAWRTRASAGLIPPMAVFLVVLTVFSVHDLVNGEVSVSRLISHVLLVAGLVLLFLVDRDRRRWQPGPRSARTAEDGESTTADDVAEARPSSARGRERRGLWPTGFRRAG